MQQQRTRNWGQLTMRSRLCVSQLMLVLPTVLYSAAMKTSLSCAQVAVQSGPL